MKEKELNEKLIEASNNGNLEEVKKLIELGANIHARDGDALIYASGNGKLKVVKYLIEQGADIHATDDYAFRHASLNGYLEVVKYLVESGANIHAQNDFGLRMALSCGHFEIVKFLILDCNCDVEIALEAARESEEYEVVEWCKKYIEAQKLNDKLENNLTSKFDKINSKKMKV